MYCIAQVVFIIFLLALLLLLVNPKKMPQFHEPVVRITHNGSRTCVFIRNWMDVQSIGL